MSREWWWEPRVRNIMPVHVELAKHNLKVFLGSVRANAIIRRYENDDAGLLDAYDEVGEKIFREIVKL